MQPILLIEDMPLVLACPHSQRHLDYLIQRDFEILKQSAIHSYLCLVSIVSSFLVILILVDCI